MQDNMLPITRPDPIETRDRLRALPRSGQMLQQTIAYLTRAAQGGVPHVEPYLALSELNEIKRETEKQASSQATAGVGMPSAPLSQSLPEQLKQTAGIASLQGLRQKQMMGQMLNKGAQMPQPVPEGTPQPVQAAGGGLMSLPRYRSGGVIAFQDRGAVEDPDANDDGENDEGGGGEAAPAAEPFSANARLAQLQAQIDAQRGRKAPTMAGPIATEEELVKKYPGRFGILNTPAGADTLKRLEEFQAQQRAEMEQRRQEMRPVSFGKILMDAAEASRGQKGFGNIAAMLMGGGKSARTQADERLKQEQAMRKEDLGLNEVKMLAQNKVDELRRAQASGDVQREVKARADLAKIEKDYNVSLNRLLGNEYTALMGYKGRVDSANIAAAARAASDARKEDKLPQVDRALAAAKIALTKLTPGTPEYEAKAAEVKVLGETLDRSRFSPERGFLMRQQLLVNEDKDIRSKMADFEFSPEMQMAKLEGPEAENRVFTKKLNELRGISRANLEDTPFPESRTPAATPRPTPARPSAQPLPAGLTGANAATLLKDGAIYQTQQGPGRWSAAKGKFVAVE